MGGELVTNILQRRRALMMRQPVDLVHGYDAFDNPTITNGVFYPEQGGWVRGKRIFAPTGAWKVRAKVSTTSTATQDILWGVDEQGQRVNSLTLQMFKMSGSDQLKLAYYCSSNGTSWDIASGGGLFNFNAPASFLFEFESTGTAYRSRISTNDGATWSAWYTYSPTPAALYPAYPAICPPRTPLANRPVIGTVDLNELEIYVDGVLWWKPV